MCAVCSAGADSPAAAALADGAIASTHAQVLIEVEKHSNFMPPSATEVYLGYGATEDEMLAAGRFRMVYRVP
jgi:hypothetical protein